MPALPAQWATQAATVLQYLPDFLDMVFRGLVATGHLALEAPSLEAMHASMRLCLGKELLLGWKQFRRRCERVLPFRRSLASQPWDDPRELIRMHGSMGFVEEAARMVAADLAACWGTFVELLLAAPTQPLLWARDEDLCEALVPDTAADFNTAEDEVGTCLLFVLLGFVEGEEDADLRGGRVAAHAARRTLKTLHAGFPQPEVDCEQPTATLHDLSRQLAEVFHCPPQAMTALLQKQHIVDPALETHGVFSAAHRVLSCRAALRLPLLTGGRARVAQLMQLRASLARAFATAHRFPGGVRLLDVPLPPHRFPKGLREGVLPLRGTDVQSVEWVRMGVYRALMVMMIKYPEYARGWTRVLARAVYLHMGGNDDSPDTPVPEALCRLARQMVVIHPDGHVLVTVLPVALHVARQTSRASRQRATYATRPVGCHPRLARAIASSFMFPLWPRQLKPTADVRLLFDGLEPGEVLFSDAEEPFRSAGDAEPLVEFGFGMPTPRMVAARMLARLPDVQALDEFACSLLWNMARAVRQDHALPALLGRIAAPQGSRKRRRASALLCMSCMEAPAEDHCGGDHGMCAPCAARLLEVRAINLEAGDASMGESLGASSVYGCPFRGCGKDLRWAARYVGTDMTYFLDRFEAAAARREEPGAAPCSLCWAWVRPEEGCGPVGTCGVCAQGTCTTCGREAHPGDVCSAVAGTLTPEMLLTEAKVQYCPKAGCRVATTKDGGCNHMVCERCGEPWCWICGGGISARDTDGHYAASAVCSQFQYNEKTETERITRSVLGRSDASEEVKSAALRMMSTLFRQDSRDI